MKKIAIIISLTFVVFGLTACISTVPPQVKNEGNLTCEVTINCTTVLENLDKLDESKKQFIPKDGFILKQFKVNFNEGETVFDLLKKASQLNNIQLEFSSSALNTSYVEGINQLYEFDLGQFSGWQYKINGEFQSYGSSSVKAKNDDKIEWIYTCELGKDIDGYVKN